MSRKSISYRRGDVAGPPDGEPWVWHTITLLMSPAWRRRPVALVMVLDFLEIENMRHGGYENGNLLAPYDDLVRFGLCRESIAAAIHEGARRGLLIAQRAGRDFNNGRRQPTRYRLTYLATCQTDPVTKIRTWFAPTDDWKRYAPQI